MQYVSTVTQKGQATIPAPIRKRLGIKPKTKILFTINNANEASLKPVVNFRSLRGSIKANKPFDSKVWDKTIAKAVAQEYAASSD